MTKDEIQKNSEHWYNKYKDTEKRIIELEKEKDYWKARCHNLADKLRPFVLFTETFR